MTEDALAYVRQRGLGALAEKMGIEMLEFSVERSVARMPVEGNTQPADLLHGGAYVVLGESLGHSDLSELRPLLGFASSALARRIPRNERVLDVVMTAAYAVTGRWNELYEEIDERRAHRVLAEWHLDHLAERTFGSLSDGEQKRVQIARSVMTDPEVLLLDEPAASLDLGGREELVKLLGGYASDPKSPAIVMVTHHVEEIPQGFNRALLLKEGRIAAAGPIAEVLTSENLSDTFGVQVELSETDGRYTARASE